MIEATNRCNTRCMHCPHESITRPMGMMTWGDYQVIADKILAYGRTRMVDFTGMGEPILNPNLARFIEYLKGRLTTWITTNASALTSRNIDKLIEAGLGTIVVSFNGADAATYELMMGGLSFQRAQAHLQDLVQRATGRIKIMANVSVTQQTRSQLKEIRRYLENIGVSEVNFSLCHSRGGHLKDRGICTTLMPPISLERCDVFHDTLFVAWNGDVLACCQDLDGVARLGNLVTDSLVGIDQFKSSLQGKGAAFAMCAECNDMYRFSHDSTPDGQPLSEWIYELYAAESEPSARLVNLVHQREAQLREAEQRARKTEELVAAYERGRFVRFMRTIKKLIPSRPSLRKT